MMQIKDIQAAQKFLAHYGFVKRCALAAAPLPRFTEDIAQEVFVEFITHSQRWDLESDVRPLLAKTTYLVARKYWRDHKKTLPPMLVKVAENIRQNEDETQKSTTERLYENEIAALRQCLDRLPAKSRKVIRSYYFDHVDTERLAEGLEIQAKSVNRMICRIREKLRLCIQQHLKKELNHGR